VSSYEEIFGYRIQVGIRLGVGRGIEEPKGFMTSVLDAWGVSRSKAEKKAMGRTETKGYFFTPYLVGNMSSFKTWLGVVGISIFRPKVTTRKYTKQETFIQ